MKLNVYAIYDAKSSLHLDFFRAKEDGVAIRMTVDALKNPQSILAKHPEDYSLYKLATFDDEKGTFENFDRPVSLVTCSALINV